MQEYNDMPDATLEVKTVENWLKKFDFKDNEISTLIDPTADDIKLAFNNLMNACFTNHINREKTLVFFYFSGHSLLDTDLQILLNAKTGFLYPIEKSLKIVANMKNSYVFSFFDCTRTRMDLSDKI